MASEGFTVSATLRERLLSSYEVSERGCWEWQKYIARNGYGEMGYGWNAATGRGVTILTHRASWIVHHGAIPEGAMVLHKCDNRKCINPDHLYIGDAQDNVNDMHERDRARKAQGIQNGHARLTREQVDEIRRRHIPGGRLGRGHRSGNTAELAEEFGITKQYVGQLTRGIWRKRA